MPRWRVSVEENAAKVLIWGAMGRFEARPFRGRIHRELMLGLRSLEIPSCGRQLRPGWSVKLPERWEARDNARDRRLLVFNAPRVGETVLEFFQPIPPELEAAIVNAFERSRSHGRQEDGRSPEAQRKALPLAGGEGAAGSGQRAEHGHAAGLEDQPEGQRLTPETEKPRRPTWLDKLVSTQPRRPFR